MAATPENVVAEVGKQLDQQTRPTKDFLVKSLRKAASALSELEQGDSLKPFIRPLRKSLVKHGLLKHKDKDVKVLVSICSCEIIRVLAPDPCFGDKELKEIFELFIDMFMELADTTSAYFPKRAKILETVARLEWCRRVVDLGCDDLVLKMFNKFFSVVREGHQKTLTGWMVSIMSLILDEAETPQPLLEVILLNLRNKGHAPASYQLAVDLIQSCEETIKPAVCGFLTSCILDREGVRSELKECYHEIIFEIFQCTPHMLVAVIPNLAQELLTDQVDVRIKCVNLIGKLLILPLDHEIHEHHYLFVELLKRFSDKSAEVRIRVIRAVKGCYMANPSGIESHKILSSLEDRLLDFDTSVRKEAVTTVCDLARFSLKKFPEVLITRATDRLRDKTADVRKVALRELMEVYREYCTKCYEGQVMLNEIYEQIPCKILMLSLDKNLKEFRPQNLELLLSEDLFPASLPVEDRTKHWIYLYSIFTPAHVRAVNSALCQKRRFQTEMQGCLSLWRKEKGIDPNKEVEERIKNSITQLSASFPNPVKAEESFHKLGKLKDNSIFDPLLQLLGEPTLLNAKAIRDKFLKKFRDEQSDVEFLEALSLKCSNNIFSSEDVRYILDHFSGSRCRDVQLQQSSFNLFSDIVRNFPLLLRGSERQFKLLMLEEDSPLCEKLIQILAKVGPFISMELSEVYPLLERLCLEGTRAQSKAATAALAALVGPSEQLLFVDLSQDKMIEDAVLFDEKSGCHMSLHCKIKIYGLKTLVKSILPKKGTHGEEKISNLLGILSKALLTGEFSDAAMACENDNAHIRLAAAKSVLQLSRRWDLHISPQIFRSTVMMAKDASSFVRKSFLEKTHKLLKEHAVPIKFACAFVLAASDCGKDQEDALSKYLVEFIKEYSRTARTLTDCPAYILVFLLHILAHDPGFPSLNSHNDELFAQFCRPLVLLLHLLVNIQSFGGDLDLVSKTFSDLQSIFRAIKRAEDTVNPQKTPELHTLADIGISILDVLKHDGINLSRAPGLVMLPSSLYKIHKDSCRSIGPVFNEKFAENLVQTFENDFNQLCSTIVKRGRKCLKDSLEDQNTVDLRVSKPVEQLENVTIRENVEPCPNGRQQSSMVHSSVIEEVEAGISGNLKHFGAKENQLDSKSSTLELFGIDSDVSTQEVDVSLSVAQQGERKRKSSYGCPENPELSKTKFKHGCSSDGSTVSFLRQCDPKKQCFGDSVKGAVSGSTEGVAEKQGTGESKRKILLDRTNKLTVNGSEIHHQPKKKSLGHKLSLSSSASDVSHVDKSAIAFRTRRRKV